MFIASTMREEDAAEVWAYNRSTPLRALEDSVKVSDFVTVVLHDGLPISMLGLRTRGIISDVGVPWLLSSSEVLKHKGLFLKLFPSVVEDMLRIRPRLENYVHVNNSTSIRWLSWAGFEFDEPIVMPFTDEKFQRFHMGVEQCVVLH